MDIANQICSLEQAKKLSELGITAPAFFIWVEYLDEAVNQWQTKVLAQFQEQPDDIKYALADSRYNAYSGTEVGVMLPAFPNYNWETYYHESDKQWRVQIMGREFGAVPTEAIGRTMILIYMLENDIVTAEECNQRLMQ